MPVLSLSKNIIELVVTTKAIAIDPDSDDNLVAQLDCGEINLV